MEVANNGDEALKKVMAAEEKYDLIITDLTMPGMGGLDFVRAMQESIAAPPSVLLTTGRPDFAFSKTEFPCVVGLLTKPFNLKTMRAKLEQLDLPKKVG